MMISASSFFSSWLRHRPVSCAIALLAVTATTSPFLRAQFSNQASVETLSVQQSQQNDTIHVPVGHTVVLTSPVALKRVYVGDPTVLHSFTSGQHEVLITSKTVGVSSLVLWDAEGRHRLYTVSGDLDMTSLRTSLSEVLPDAVVHAEANQAKIVLSGTVKSDAASDTAAKLAAEYSKDVVNNLRVVGNHGKQVELKLRIVEVDRTKLEQFGFNFFTAGGNVSGLTTQQFGSTQYTPKTTGNGGSTVTFDPLNLLFFSASSGAGLTIKDLEEKNIIQILAEPTLTTLSGQPARFLSGGEFPFPVVQGGVGTSTAITIMFRPYGVKVDFTPTVNGDGSIHLKVNPEVSALDYTNAVTISGYTIPALSTRRAETEIEIRNGESFVVSGLLDHRTTEALSKVPGIADLPLLGQLFRSRNLNHSVVELVVVVTATVVDPLAAPPPVVEPKFTVPNMSRDHFDKAYRDAGKLSPFPSSAEKGTP